MQITIKCSTWVIDYNENYNLNDDYDNVEFINANHKFYHLYQEKHIIEIDDKDNKFSKLKTIWDKKRAIKNIERKDTKALIPIFWLISLQSPNISVLLLNTNIILLILHLFPMSSSFT